jgi:hypothetical protein
VSNTGTRIAPIVNSFSRIPGLAELECFSSVISKSGGYSVFDSALDSMHNAKWLFHSALHQLENRYKRGTAQIGIAAHSM